MSDFDEGMVLRRIGELIEEGELPPIAHGLLRLLGIAIEQEAALEQARVEAAHLRRALAQVQADMDIFRGQISEAAPKSVMMNLEAMQERVAAALAATEKAGGEDV